jgi:RNA polymerase-binding transcription factor DksA
MEIKRRLEAELQKAMERIRQSGGATVIADLPDAVGAGNLLSDAVDAVQVSYEREMGFATRSLLVQRTRRLVQALDRLDRGEYGMCQGCGKEIAPARLRALPEVTSCVPCQDRLERRMSQSAGYSRVTVDQDEE